MVAATIFSGVVGAGPSAALTADKKKSEAEAINYALLSYQGVHMDPGHPKGHRVLIGNK